VRALMTRGCRARRGGAAKLSRRRMWHGRPEPTPGARRGWPAWHLCRAGACGAAGSQARPKGSPGAYNVCQGLFFKIIKKRLKLKNCSQLSVWFDPPIRRMVQDRSIHD
jgi:hypothetical protein